MPLPDLTDTELRRYARHLLLPEVGLDGQRRLRATKVLCLGAGGLGSPVAIYLAAAGIGRLGVVDFDQVELANLHRQPLHGTADLGRSKCQSARQTLQRLNPEVEVVLHETRLAADNALDLLAPYDIVVDGTDNFPTRYLANDACVLLKKPLVYGAVLRFEGQASIFAPHLGGPCYRCLFPQPPPPDSVPDCAQAGVLGVVPGLIGCIQATETLKLALGRGALLLGRLLLYDALAMRFRELKLRRDPRCPVCGEQPTITKLTDSQPGCAGGTPPEPVPPPPDPDEVTVHELKQALEDPALGIRVLDVRELWEQRLAPVAGVIPLPFSELAQRWAELDPARPFYLLCQSGARSTQAAAWLRARGFRQARSVQGGLRAWAATFGPLPAPRPSLEKPG